MQSMEKGFHLKFLEYASEKTRWVFWWVFSSGYEVKKPGGFFRVGWVFSNVDPATRTRHHGHARLQVTR